MAPCAFDAALFLLRIYRNSRQPIQGLQTGLRMLSDPIMRFFGAVLSVCLAFAACKKELSVGVSCRPGSGQSNSGSICDARPGIYQSKIRGHRALLPPIRGQTKGQPCYQAWRFRGPNAGAQR